MSNDPRAQYLANTAGHMLNIQDLTQKIAADTNIADFLNKQNIKALQIITNGKSFKVISGKVAEPPAGTMELHFVKLDNVDITADKIQSQIIVSSIRQSSISSLHALINRIYVPLLKQGDNKPEKEGVVDKNNQLRDLLYSLRAGLHQTIRKGGTNLRKFTFDIEEFKGVIDPMDEISTWQDVENENVVSNENEKLRANAEIINRHFSKVLK